MARTSLTKFLHRWLFPKPDSTNEVSDPTSAEQQESDTEADADQTNDSEDSPPQDETKRFRILVYGIDKVNLPEPAVPIESGTFEVTFASYLTKERFNQYDGVILYQGIFETFVVHSGYSTYTAHTCDRDELDKRKKELNLLIRAGGFVCFLLHKPFEDSVEGRNVEGTDLCKYVLNLRHLYRKNFASRISHIHIVQAEFQRFLEIYGAASSYFNNLDQEREWTDIARIDQHPVGMILRRQMYFVPTLIPDLQEDRVNEYFTFLCDAVISTYKKQQRTLPNWIENYTFDEELTLKQELAALQDTRSQVMSWLDTFVTYKSILALNSDALVASVTDLFRLGFGIDVDDFDELHEDIKLIDSEQSPFCLCEVKGTNRGVKREHINQTDSHREHSGFNHEFPAVLIINTHIKNARTVEGKDQEVAREQIAHAAKMNVLIMRTLDLLNLLRLHLRGEIALDKIVELLTTSRGWLRVSEDQFEIVS